MHDQGCAKFDNNVKAEDERREKDWAVCLPIKPVYWCFGSAGIRFGGEGSGNGMGRATVGEWFLGGLGVGLLRYEPATLL